MSTPMHSIVQVQESPPLIGQGLLPKQIVVPYLNSFDFLVEENPPLIGQGLLPEPIVIAVPELLHVYADDLHVQ